ncbi:MAG: T9SS type A sorting domain-containing protein [Bacteroidales bacterium]|nr:T9SS type A sorting domain-containing protein [Bacteroidales bacterium]
MRHKKLELSVVLLLGLGLSGLHAQEAIPASGGNGSGTGGSVSYTIGQVVYNTNTGTNGTEAQGVQQPFEISVVTAIEEAKVISLEFVVYPNPAKDYVILKTGTYDVENLNYYLYDGNGRLLDKDKVQGNETTISMRTLLPSTYFLKVIDNNRVIKIFKIIKY